MDYEHPFYWFVAESWNGLWFVFFLYWPVWLSKAGRWSSLWADGGKT